MEKDLIEMSRYFGENREAVIYRIISEERVNGMKTYQLHLYEGKKKVKDPITFVSNIDQVEDYAGNFVTYNDED